MEKRKTRETLCDLEKANVRVRWVNVMFLYWKWRGKGFVQLLILQLVRCFSNFIRHIHIIHLYINNISKGLLTSGDFSLICPIFQVCECGDGYLFLGSRLGNSLLVKYTEKAQDTGMSTTFSKHVCLSAVISREQKSCYLKQWHSHQCVELKWNYNIFLLFICSS